MRDTGVVPTPPASSRNADVVFYRAQVILGLMALRCVAVVLPRRLKRDLVGNGAIAVVDIRLLHVQIKVYRGTGLIGEIDRQYMLINSWVVDNNVFEYRCPAQFPNDYGRW